MSSSVAEITIGSNTFMVLNADISYYQQTQIGGKASSDIRGGTFSVEIESSEGLKYDQLAAWMFSKSLTQKGVIRFYKNDGIGRLFDLEFYDAFCVKYSEHFNYSDSQVMITFITISPGICRVRNLLMEKSWKVSDLLQIFSKFIFGDVKPLKNLITKVKSPVKSDDYSVFENCITNIIIDGDAEFVAQVKSNLKSIYQTPTGKKLIESLKNEKAEITIVPTLKGNSCSLNGGKSIVNFNPIKENINSEPWGNRPPAIGLAHELIHSHQSATNSISKDLVDNDNKMDFADPTKVLKTKKVEVEAVGVHPFDTGEFTENKIRAEWDPQQPLREYY